MTVQRSGGAEAPPAAVEEAEDAAESSEGAGEGLLAELLAQQAVDVASAQQPSHPALAGVRTARLVSVSGRKATIALRGRRDPVSVEIAPEVEPEIVADALANGESVLVEPGEGELPLIVAVLQTRRPREIKLKATVVHIEGDEEVLLRSGRGAVRIRSDGDIEVVGSRISAASRGLFRIVGRMLRLN
jgi:hypothetical protein